MGVLKTIAVGLCVASLSSFAVDSAHAQSSSDKAEKLVRQGLKHARGGNFKKARDKFSEAVKLEPEPVYMHNLARALQKLGQLPQAYRWFSQALRTSSDYKFASDARKHIKSISKKLKKTHGRLRVQSTPQGVTCDIITSGAAAESMLKTPFERWVPAGEIVIKGRKARYIDGKTTVTIGAGEEKIAKIRLEPQPLEGYLEVLADAPDAVVFINGKEIGPAPLKNHVVTSGSYKVEIRAPNYKSFTKVVVVEPDATERLVARMVSTLKADAAGDGSQKKASDPLPGFVLTGAGAAILVAGGVLTGLAYAKKAESEPIPLTPEGDDLVAEIQGLGYGGWAAVGVGAVLVGVGIYFIVSADSESSSTTSALDVVPSLTVDRSGLRAGASFSF